MTTKRSIRMLAIGVVLAAVLAACGSSGSSKTETGSPGTTGGAASGDTVASTMVFGGAPECPTRPLLPPGPRDHLRAEVQGLQVARLRAARSPWPPSRTATSRSASSSPPTARSRPTTGCCSRTTRTCSRPTTSPRSSTRRRPTPTAASSPTSSNQVSAKITTEDLTDLNKQVDVDKKDPDAVAKQWVEDSGLVPATAPAAKAGPPIVVGSANFTESEILANIYAEVLQGQRLRRVRPSSRSAAARSTCRRCRAARSTFIPDYAGTLLTFVDKNADPEHRPRHHPRGAGGRAEGQHRLQQDRGLRLVAGARTRTASWSPRRPPTSTTWSRSATCPRRRRPDLTGGRRSARVCGHRRSAHSAWGRNVAWLRSHPTSRRTVASTRPATPAVVGRCRVPARSRGPRRAVGVVLLTVLAVGAAACSSSKSSSTPGLRVDADEQAGRRRPRATRRTGGGPVPTGFEPASVTFVSADQGFVLGTAPCSTPPCTSMVGTDDGGATWHGLPAPAAPLAASLSDPSPDDGPSAISEVRFGDHLDGWAFGPGALVDPRRRRALDRAAPRRHRHRPGQRRRRHLRGGHHLPERRLRVRAPRSTAPTPPPTTGRSSTGPASRPRAARSSCTPGPPGSSARPAPTAGAPRSSPAPTARPGPSTTTRARPTTPSSTAWRRSTRPTCSCCASTIPGPDRRASPCGRRPTAGATTEAEGAPPRGGIAVGDRGRRLEPTSRSAPSPAPASSTGRTTAAGPGPRSTSCPTPAPASATSASPPSTQGVVISGEPSTRSTPAIDRRRSDRQPAADDPRRRRHLDPDLLHLTDHVAQPVRPATPPVPRVIARQCRIGDSEASEDAVSGRRRCWSCGRTG